MKLQNLMNMSALLSHIETAKSFKDANGVLLAQSLTHLDPKIFMKLYPDNVFLNSGLTIDNTGGLVDSIKKKRVSAQGSFSNASNRGANKGLISLNGEADVIGVIGREATINYTDDEIGKAKLENYNLVERLLGAVDEVYRQEIDETLAIGNTLNKGLLNYDGFTADTSSAITTLTGEQAYDAIAELIIDQWNGVNNTNGYMANRVIMPVRVLNILSSKKWNTVSSEKSVMQVLKDAFPSVTFASSWRNESVGGTSVTIAYATSEDAMTNRIPLPLLIGETIKDGSFSYKADATYRIAGLDVHENKAGRIVTGL